MDKVMFFYNANFNYLDKRGQSKFIWGVVETTEEEFNSLNVVEFLIERSGYDEKDIFNLNLTAFNRV